MLSRIRTNKLFWRWILNSPQTISHLLDGSEKTSLHSELSVLESEGLLMTSAPSLFDEQGLHFLKAIKNETKQKVNSPEIQDILKDPPQLQPKIKNKDYIIHLFDSIHSTFDLSSPFIQFALHPRLLSLVNAYMGMRSRLQGVMVWLNVPTPAEAKETQLWHRDGDDVMNVKVFVYLKDVNEGAGPFTFIPKTHPKGILKSAAPKQTNGRTTDEDMEKVIPRNQWKLCVGKEDTVIIADTTGFHKGLKPTSEHRLLLNIHYTSHRPLFPNVMTLRGNLNNSSLKPAQRVALQGSQFIN